MSTPALIASDDLGGALTIRTVAQAHAVLLARLQDSDSVCLDAPEDFEIDLAGVQLLLAARVYAGVHGKSFKLQNPAAGRLREVLDGAGLTAAATSEDLAFWGHDGGGR